MGAAHDCSGDLSEGRGILDGARGREAGSGGVVVAVVVALSAPISDILATILAPPALSLLMVSAAWCW